MKAPVSYDVPFEWGPAGRPRCAFSSCLVVVDVLSFSTSVTVAAEAGTRSTVRLRTSPGRVRPVATRPSSPWAAGRIGRPALVAVPGRVRRAPFTPRWCCPRRTARPSAPRRPRAKCAAFSRRRGRGRRPGAAKGPAAGEARVRRGRGDRGRWLPAQRRAVAVSCVVRLGRSRSSPAGERVAGCSPRPALEDLLAARSRRAARPRRVWRPSATGVGLGLFSPAARLPAPASRPPRTSRRRSGAAASRGVSSPRAGSATTWPSRWRSTRAGWCRSCRRRLHSRPMRT